MQYLADGCAEEVVDVDEVEDLDAGGQGGNSLVDDLLAIFDDLAGVGAGCLADGDAYGLFAVGRIGAGIALGAQLDAGDIF
jgi:hypothetical protein